MLVIHVLAWDSHKHVVCALHVLLFPFFCFDKLQVNEYHCCFSENFNFYAFVNHFKVYILQLCKCTIFTIFLADASVQPTICSQCLCSNSQIVLSGQELQDKLKDLYTLLSVNKRNTSLYLRTQSSATDTRLSSKSIGVTRVILLLSVMLFILVLDILPRK